MKNLLSLSTLLISLSASAIAGPALPAWAAVNRTGQPVRIAVSPQDDGNGAHLSWPKVIRTTTGTTILAYSAGRGHNIGGSALAVSLSHDNGQTFSAPRELIRFPEDDDRYRDCGNIALGLAEDGSILLFAMAYNQDTANNIYGWRSVTDGATWMRVDTSTLGPDKTGSIFGNIVPIADTGIAVFGHYRKGSVPHDQGLWMALSPDQGRSWNEARRIANMHAVEPVVLESAGRLLGFFRGDAATDRGRQYVGVSNDQGQTWSTELSNLQAQDSVTARLAAPFAVEDPAHPGELIVLTTERSSSDDTRGCIWLWRGNAEQLEWQRERILLEFPLVGDDPNTDFGYPWLIHQGGNRWQMYYYHGNPRGTCYIWTTDVEL